MISQPISHGPTSGILILLTSSRAKNHHAMAVAKADISSKRTRSRIPVRSWVTSYQSFKKPIRAPISNVASGIQVCDRLTNERSVKICLVKSRSSVKIVVVVISTDPQMTIPPIRGVFVSPSPLRRLNSVAASPLRAVLPPVFFHILYLYKKCVRSGVSKIPTLNAKRAGKNILRIVTSIGRWWFILGLARLVEWRSTVSQHPESVPRSWSRVR